MDKKQVQDTHQDMVSVGCPAQTSHDELYYLTDLVSSPSLPHGHVLEIGSAWGATTRILALANAERGIPDEHVYSLEPYTPNDATDPFRIVARATSLIATCRMEPRIYHMTMTVQELSKLQIGRVFRFIFLDAYHEYENVLSDLHTAVTMTNFSGVICSHDMHGTGNLGAERAWQEIVEQGGIPDENGIWIPEVGFKYSIGTLRWSECQ